MSANLAIKALRKSANSKKAKVLQRFFKTGKGEYAAGDLFLGISVPVVRSIAKQYADLELFEIKKLLHSKYHEVRLLGLIILVIKFQRGEKSDQALIFKFYLSHLKCINNWDLVDVSARDIIGAFLWTQGLRDRQFLYRMAESNNLWERRISIISTFYFIQKGEGKETLKLARVLLNDREDLIQKAVGWMLREIGKRIDEKLLTDFLDENCNHMPRTMLRYSIERLSKPLRKKYMAAKFARSE